MKKLLLFFLLIFTIQTYSQEKVPLAKINLHEGETVTVCEKVQGTFLSKKSNTLMINFGKPYPNQTFVVVVFNKDLEHFSYNPAEKLKGKTICITGKVVNYKGMPEIIVTDEKAITY